MFDPLERPQVLVVEDDAFLCADLVDYLNRQAVPTQGVPDGESLRQAMAQYSPDVLIVDIVLPGEDGLSLIRTCRAAGFTGGIIVLTVMGQTTDIVTGYAMGADIYLTKHAELRVVEACVRRLISRADPTTPMSSEEEAAAVIGAPWRLDLVRRLLFTRRGQTVKLTGKELQILRILAGEPGRAIGRATLVGLPKLASLEEERRVDAVVSRLRRKVRQEAEEDLPVDHVYGVGYAFSDHVEVLDSGQTVDPA